MEQVLKVGADAGNNALKLWVKDHKPFMIQAVYSHYIGDAITNMEAKDIQVDEIVNHLDVTITSPSLSNLKERIIVGQKVLDDQLDAIEMEKRSDKSTDEIPLITTLCGLMVDAIKRFPEKDHIEVAYDLSVALPLKTITPEAAERHEKRFRGVHTVVFHHPSGRDIKVEIKVVFSKCLAEGATGAWAVTYNEEGESNKRIVEIEETNNGKKNFIEVTFEDKLQLHFDIGAGTIEEAVTKGVALQYKQSDGLEYGTKNSILDFMSIWNKNNPRKHIDSITEFNDIYFNSEHPRHNQVKNAAAPILKSLAIKISKEIINKIDSIKDDVYVFIYGGGAALLKDYLQAILQERGRDHNVIFLNDPIYVNAKGLLVYTCSPRFEELKQEALGVA